MAECVFNSEDSVIANLGFDYVKAYYCQFNENGYLFFPCLLGWAAFLTYLLGHTADAYFSPTLATLSDKLKLTYDVAGVTFLALGNGAPDVFSSVAAFSSKDPSVVLIGVCELLGGAVFVTTVVVGLVSILHPASVRPQAFVRDILFQALANLLLTISALYGRVTIGLAFVYLGFYALYVLLVIYLDRAQRRKAHAGGLQLSGDDFDISGGVMSAFWFTPSDIDEFHRATENSTVHKLTHDFLLLDDDELSSSDEDEEDCGSSEGRPSSVTVRRPEEGEQDNRSSFSHNVIKEYFTDPTKDVIDGRSLLSDKEKAENSKSKSRQRPSPTRPTFAPFNTATNVEAAYDADDRLSSTCSSSVRENHGNGNDGLYGNNGGGGLSRSLSASAAGGATGLARTRQIGRKHNSVWDNMYWHQWRWRRRLLREFHSSDFLERSLGGKILNIIEFPVVTMRNLTIPLVEEDSWSRLYASLVPIFAPLFLMYITGSLHSTFGHSGFHVWILVEMVAVMVAIGVNLTTHQNHPPASFTYVIALTAVGFIMCAAWIYTIASELVAVIETLGVLWNIPSSLLGLTMMAWGNSAGDLITNIAVARAGLSDMAVAGCFAGPTFNLLVGLGLSFFVKCSVSGSFALVFDQRAYICLTFLYIGLGMNLGIAYFSGFKLGRGLAIPLLTLYIFSSLLQVALMISGAIDD